MKILISAVNYNSYPELNNYLISIDRAAGMCADASVFVVVADNSTERKVVDISLYKNIQTEICVLNNLGYLGGAQYVINKCEDIRKYDYVIISNVDIEMPSGFFQKLEEYRCEDDIAWIATKIWSREEGRDRNPKILSRYSKKKLKMINLMYKYPILDYLYNKTLYKRKVAYTPKPEMDLYAGHGSFMMLTKAFFLHYKRIDYPIFLFGEELYLAELIRKANMRVHYVPDLEVIDKEHVSTGKMRKSFYYKCNKESIDYILKCFYNE